MTEHPARRILSIETWPTDLVADDLNAVLSVFDCGTLEDLEDHVFGLLPEDPGAVSIQADAGDLNISTGLVAMWSLPFPITGESLDAYLFELDERGTLQTVLDRLPGEEEWIAEGRADFTPTMAWLLRTTDEDFRAALGGGWNPVGLDWVGSTSNPTHFLWTGSAVIGLDNCNAYVFRETDSASDNELDGKHYVEVAWAADIWDADGLRFDWFSSFVRDALAEEPRGVCPKCGSGEVFHLLLGFPAGIDSLPSWVRLGGCVVEEGFTDRFCDGCGHAWRAQDTANPMADRAIGPTVP